MCGLFGALSRTDLIGSEIDSVKELGLVSSLRGRDSTGLLIGYQPLINGRDYLHILKSMNEAGPFLFDRKISKALDDTKPFFIAGHCRAATIGQVNEETAHPYRYRHIQGMHNGTVPSMDPGKEFEDTYTDSRMIIESLANEGLAKTVEEMRYGAYALVWANNQDKTINFYRNDKRTLYFMETTDGTMYWASEICFLNFIKERSWCSASYFKDIKPVEAGVHYEFPFRSLNAKETSIPFPVEPKSPAAGFTSIKQGMGPPYYGVGGAYSDYDESWTSYLRSDNDPPWKSNNTEWLDRADYDKAKEAVEKALKRPLAEALQLKTGYKGYNGEEMSLMEAERRLGDGCSGCGTCCELDDEDPSADDEVFWIGSNEYICGECMDGDWHQQFTKGHNCTLGERTDD